MLFSMLFHCCFAAVSLLFRADVNVVPKAFHLYIYMCFSIDFSMFLIMFSHSRCIYLFNSVLVDFAMTSIRLLHLD